MVANSTQEQDLSKTLSMQLVEQIAPEELEIFDELYEDTLIHQHQAPSSSADDELGFGITGAMVAVTPVVTLVVNAVISFLVTEVIQAAKNESSAVIQEKVKALFGSKKEDRPAPLTQDQLGKVKKLAYKRAREAGMSEEKANQLALALVGSLAL